ncbi:MAG TPA: SpoIIIAH-like family protein [Firmicutes bacterium]|nr:SpoIIIAH-like family protein [Bacillota bacterium]
MLIIVKRRHLQYGAIFLGLGIILLCLFSMGEKEAQSPIAKATLSAGNDMVVRPGGEEASALSPYSAGPGETAPTASAPERISGAVTNPDFFAAYRLERDRVRSVQAELLRSASTDKSLSENRRAQLTDELMALLRKNELEVETEALLMAGGFADAVVVLGTSGATVVVPRILTAKEAAQIGELVSRVCGLAPERITIMDAATGRS